MFIKKAALFFFIFSSVAQSAFTQNDSGSLLERAISAAHEAADRVLDENRKKEKSNYTPRDVQSNNNYGQNNRYNDTKTYQNNRPNVNQYGYVDLGLSSGVLWKRTNEPGYYSIRDAVSTFGPNLPTEDQWRELKRECTWTWNGNGYKVTGPNGNYIHLTQEGYINTLAGKTYESGKKGRYCLNTRTGTFFEISKSEIGFFSVSSNEREYSVRLVSYY